MAFGKRMQETDSGEERKRIATEFRADRSPESQACHDGRRRAHPPRSPPPATPQHTRAAGGAPSLAAPSRLLSSTRARF
eukprot:5698573-Prymnesium_polylepis.1